MATQSQFGLLVIFERDKALKLAVLRNVPARTFRLKNVATKLPGQHFGELSLLDPGSSTAADVVAAGNATVLLLTPDSFRSICRVHESFKSRLLSSMPAYATYNFFFHMPCFRDAQHDFLLALVKAVQREKFDSGAVVQRMHEQSAGCFFVEKGQLLATAPRYKPSTLRER